MCRRYFCILNENHRFFDQKHGKNIVRKLINTKQIFFVIAYKFFVFYFFIIILTNITFVFDHNHKKRYGVAYDVVLSHVFYIYGHTSDFLVHLHMYNKLRKYENIDFSAIFVTLPLTFRRFSFFFYDFFCKRSGQVVPIQQTCLIHIFKENL